MDLVSNAVRAQGNIPLVVDFEKPASNDLTGTVETLARLARFVVADLSEPRSVPHELAIGASLSNLLPGALATAQREALTLKEEAT
ncbi:MAG: hypothetical protein ACTHNP_06330 [Solirubrobacterales bacterium]